MTRRKPMLKPAAMLAALFALGGVTGVFGTLAFEHQRESRMLRAGPRGFEERRLNGLTRRLDLDDDQREQVRTLMEQNRETGRALGKKMMDECGAPAKAQHEAYEASLKKLLRPEQAEKLEALQKERHAFEGPPPPPFP